MMLFFPGPVFPAQRRLPWSRLPGPALPQPHGKRLRPLTSGLRRGEAPGAQGPGLAKGGSLTITS